MRRCCGGTSDLPPAHGSLLRSCLTSSPPGCLTSTTATQPDVWPMPRISIGDCQLYYERHGAGFPVLFVSGLAGTAQYWRDQLPAFARASRSSCTIIAASARAITAASALHGRADGGRCRRPDGCARASTKAHIVGHSAGGAVAQILAIEHPQRARQRRHRRQLDQGRRLFPPPLRAAQGDPGAARPGDLCAGEHAAALSELTTSRATTRSCARSRRRLLAHFPPPEIVMSRIDAILAFDRTAELGRIRTPTLVVAAQDDLVTPAYFSEELARRIPGRRGQVLSPGRPLFHPGHAARVQPGGPAFPRRPHARA